MKKIIVPGERIPLFYGIAYVDYNSDEAVCYPLFINLAVVLARDFYFWLRNPKGRRW